MITLLGAIIGFIGSAFPDMLKLFRDTQDRKHELAILQMQMAQKDQGHTHRIAEITASADIAESRALYKTYHSGITWVDALNATVRPVIAYAFFGLYVYIKTVQFMLLPDSPLPWQIVGLWSPDDQAIFAGIISFYFGQRAMNKVRNGK